MKEIITSGEQVLEWAFQHQAVFLVLLIVVCYFFWKLQVKNTEMFEKELEESKEERKAILSEHKEERDKFLHTLNQQQVLIDKQYELQKAEKEQINRIENKMDNVDRKMDIVLAKAKDE